MPCGMPLGTSHRSRPSSVRHPPSPGPPRPSASTGCTVSCTARNPSDHQASAAYVTSYITTRQRAQCHHKMVPVVVRRCRRRNRLLRRKKPSVRSCRSATDIRARPIALDGIAAPADEHRAVRLATCILYRSQGPIVASGVEVDEPCSRPSSPDWLVRKSGMADRIVDNIRYAR